MYEWFFRDREREIPTERFKEDQEIGRVVGDYVDLKSLVKIPKNTELELSLVQQVAFHNGSRADPHSETLSSMLERICTDEFKFRTGKKVLVPFSIVPAHNGSVVFDVAFNRNTCPGYEARIKVHV